MSWKKGTSIGVYRAATLIFVIAIPVLLVTTNLRIAFGGVWLYTYGFEKFDVSRSSGIPDSELRRVAQEIVTYWNSDAEFLSIQIAGQPLYNQREVIHMRDVKVLINGLFRVQEWAAALILLCILVGWLRERGAIWKILLARVRTGGIVSLTLLVSIGIALGIAFPWLFHVFHLISFNNDFWQLDPRQDALIQMFPQGFWYMTTMLVVATTALQAVLLTFGAWLVMRRLGGHIA
jgi:integral membrane protein (TIGR01906 family)